MSKPVVSSSLLYAGATALLASASLGTAPAWAQGAGLAVASLGGFVFGVACGMARERAESLLPCSILHAGGVALAWLAPVPC